VHSFIYCIFDTGIRMRIAHHVMHSSLKTCGTECIRGRAKNTCAHMWTRTWLVYTRKMHYCARSDGSTCIRIRLNDKWKRTECVSSTRFTESRNPRSIGTVTEIRTYFRQRYSVSSLAIDFCIYFRSELHSPNLSIQKTTRRFNTTLHKMENCIFPELLTGNLYI